MKTLTTILSVLVLVALVAPYGFASTPPLKTVSGRVEAVSHQAIVIDVGSGKTMLDVGAVVQPDTKVMVNGKSTPIGDLTKEVKVGDNVRLSYVMTNDLYAKEITKK